MATGHMYNAASIVFTAIGPLMSKFGVIHISPGKAALVNMLTVIVASFIWGLISRNKVVFYVAKDVMWMALFNAIGVIALFISISLLSPVMIGFLGRLYTIFAVILAVLILKERMTKKEVVFIAVALLGTFLFVGEGGGESALLIGVITAIIYTFFFALTNIYIKKTQTKDRNANAILFTNNVIALGFVLVYVLFTDDLSTGFRWQGAFFIVLSSLFTGFVGTLLFFKALQYMRFSIANVTRAFSPVLLAVISFPFFPIAITAQNIVGAVILLGSIVLLAMEDQKTEKKKDEKSPAT
ncbi:EamA family transporter [Bacillus sp. FSL W7-1360]